MCICSQVFISKHSTHFLTSFYAIGCSCPVWDGGSRSYQKCQIIEWGHHLYTLYTNILFLALPLPPPPALLRTLLWMIALQINAELLTLSVTRKWPASLSNRHLPSHSNINIYSTMPQACPAEYQALGYYSVENADFSSPIRPRLQNCDLDPTLDPSFLLSLSYYGPLEMSFTDNEYN